jgi:hypothetical protein
MLPVTALAFVFCFGGGCHPVELLTDQHLLACIHGGQAQAMQWISKHRPGAELKSWHCVWGRGI